MNARWRMEQRGALGHASQALCNSFLTVLFFFFGGGVMRGGCSWLKPMPGLQIPSCPEQSLRERDLHFQWRVIFVEHKLDQVLQGLSSLPQSPACSTPAGSQPASSPHHAPLMWFEFVALGLSAHCPLRWEHFVLQVFL